MSTTTGEMRKYKVTDPQGNVYSLDPVDSEARQQIDDAELIQFDEDYFTADEDSINKEVNIGLNGVPIGVDETLQFVQDDANGIAIGVNATVESGRITEIGGTPVGADVSSKADKSELPTNKAAAQGGTDDSLVTTGDKYRWNSWVSGNVKISLDSISVGGKKYSVTRIGNQIWTTSNLDWQWPGLDVGNSGKTHEYPKANYPADNEATYGKYGLLYNWYAATYLNANKQTMLPDGWHVPSSGEWATLMTYVNNDSTKLKSKTGWNGTQGTDDYYMSIYPVHMYGGDPTFGFWTGLWSTTQYLESSGIYTVIPSTGSMAGSMTGKNEELGIRLVYTVV